jgi:hypothetical protein
MNAKENGPQKYACSKCSPPAVTKLHRRQHWKEDADRWEFMARACPVGPFGIDADDEFAAAFAKVARGAVLTLIGWLRDEDRLREAVEAQVKRWEDKEVFRSVCCDDAHRALDDLFDAFVVDNSQMTEWQQKAAKAAFRVLEGMRESTPPKALGAK